MGQAMTCARLCVCAFSSPVRSLPPKNETYGRRNESHRCADAAICRPAGDF